MNRAWPRSASALRGGLLLLMAASAGCSPSPTPLVGELTDPPPDHLLPPDEMMSCPAIASSFRYAARRVARLQSVVAARPSGFGTGQLRADAPDQIKQEEERLDALADLQRQRGCPVFDPIAAVAAESAAIQPFAPVVQAPPNRAIATPVVLHAPG